MDVSDKAVFKRPSDSGEKTVVLAAKTLQTRKETREILPEDEYVEKLTTIIQRDYFPDVPKLKAQLEYIKAVDRNDVAKIRELQLRYSTKRTDRRTSPTRRSPDVFDPETPGTSRPRDSNVEGDNDAANPSGKTGSGKMKSEDMSVDQFLGKYTSEDNASFTELAALNDQRERIKHAWMYKAEEEHNKLRVGQGPEAIKGADEQFALPAPPRPCDIDNWTYTARNTVLFNPPGAPLTVEEHIRQQKMNQREIRKEGTRFIENPWKEHVKQDTMNRAALLHAASAKGHVDVSGEVTGFKHPGQQFSMLATPSPAPGVAESPMMTWGEIEGTPFRLDASDLTLGDGGPVFKMPDVPYRDKLALEMNDTIGKRYRERRQKAVQQAESLHT
uniref:Protein DGCR14 n=1 Tax=Plectus sambesii TaxID=2011161 RepID=A0A914WGX0_9BILA